MFMNMKKGFTIVELLVVMAIIGLLTALLLIGIPALQRTTRNTARANDLSGIKGQMEVYYGRYRNYPISIAYSLSGTVPQIGLCTASGCTLASATIKVNIGQPLASGTILNSVPTACNADATNWSIVYIGQQTHYTLQGCLEGGPSSADGYISTDYGAQ